MVMPDVFDCTRCQGRGTLKIKTRTGTIVLTCGCRVGRLLAATVDLRYPVTHG